MVSSVSAIHPSLDPVAVPELLPQGAGTVIAIIVSAALAALAVFLIVRAVRKKDPPRPPEEK
jgi:hypothetical protein